MTLWKEVYKAHVEGNIVRGWPQRTYPDQKENILKKTST